jgi:hypothetical protein
MFADPIVSRDLVRLAEGVFGAVALLTAVSAFAVLAPSLRVFRVKHSGQM